MVISKVGIHKKGEITLEDLIQAAKKIKNINEAGAIVTFTGIVRGFTKDGKEVSKLEYEAYEEEVIKSFEKICNDAEKDDEILYVMIHHVIDELKVSEDIVYVVVVGKHRKAVFRTLEEVVERFKKESPIWKKEHTTEGTAKWIANA